VQLGSKVKAYYEVKEGLEEGEVVVTGANFLLDSESRLQAVIQQKGEAAPEVEKKPPEPAHNHQHGDQP